MSAARTLALAALGLFLTACQGTAQQVIPATATSAPPIAPTPRPSPTLAPTATPIPPTATLPATATPEPPTMTPTPAPALRRLTESGCCSQPFWSPDSQQVWYIDRPDERPAGVWGVSVEGDAVPMRIVDRPVFFSPDGAYVYYLEGGQTVIERRADGQRFTPPTQARPVTFSPDATEILWQISPQTAGFNDRQPTEIWMAALDGGDARRVFTVYGGSVADWFPDGRRLLMTGKRDPNESNRAVFVYDTESGESVELMRGERPRNVDLSPDGSWVVVMNTFSDDPAEDGIWLIRADGSERRKVDAALFGAFIWRDGEHLLVIPMQREQASHVVWEVEASSGESRRLTDPALTPISIADGDWRLSPDGRWLAFVAAEDWAIWIVSLTK
jgi:Tol biopolymer transport system component